MISSTNRTNICYLGVEHPNRKKRRKLGIGKPRLVK